MFAHILTFPLGRWIRRFVDSSKYTPLIISVHCISDTSSNPDADGWKEASNGYKYRLSENGLPYRTAVQRCSEYGSILVTRGMRDATLRSEIISMLGLHQRLQVWIGLDSLQERDRWVWLDGVLSTNENTLWSVGEPNNSADGNERCVQIRGEFDWEANDASCHRHYDFICEKCQSALKCM